MSVETITVGTVKARASHILTGLATYSTAFGTELSAAVHAALRDFVLRARPQDFRVFATITTVAGTAEYGLDDEFIELIEPGVSFAASDYRTLLPLSAQEYSLFQLQRNRTNGDPTHYFISRRHTDGKVMMWLYPTPSSTRTINYFFLTLPDTLLGVSDSTVVDQKLAPEYQHLLTWGTVAQFPRYLSTNPDLQFYWNKWEQGIKEAREHSDRVAGRVHQRLPYTGRNLLPGRYYPFQGNPTAPVSF